MATKTEVFNLIDKIANEKGLDEEGRAFLAQIARVESNGNANAKTSTKENGKKLSSAQGVFQFIDETWEGLVKRYPKELTMNGRSDVKQQVIAAIYFTKENEQKLIDGLGGHPPTMGQLYLAHFSGAEGALKVLKADPSTRIDTLLSKKAMESNGSFIDNKGQKQKGVYLKFKNGDELLFKDFTAGDLIYWAHDTMKQPYEYKPSRKDKGIMDEIMDFFPKAFGDMQMSTIAMIATAVIALVCVVFSGSSSGSQSPPPTPSKGGGRGLFS